jgi:hypothetical protein
MYRSTAPSKQEGRCFSPAQTSQTANSQAENDCRSISGTEIGSLGPKTFEKVQSRGENEKIHTLDGALGRIECHTGLTGLAEPCVRERRAAPRGQKQSRRLARGAKTKANLKRLNVRVRPVDWDVSAQRSGTSARWTAATVACGRTPARSADRPRLSPRVPA